MQGNRTVYKLTLLTAKAGKVPESLVEVIISCIPAPESAPLVPTAVISCRLALVATKPPMNWEDNTVWVTTFVSGTNTEK